jgi:hypothetical protein
MINNLFYIHEALFVTGPTSDFPETHCWTEHPGIKPSQLKGEDSVCYTNVLRVFIQMFETGEEGDLIHDLDRRHIIPTVKIVDKGLG